MGKSSVEFALGFNQIIKGIDRALPQMSIGERAKIFVSPEYACKSLNDLIRFGWFCL